MRHLLVTVAAIAAAATLLGGCGQRADDARPAQQPSVPVSTAPATSAPGSTVVDPTSPAGKPLPSTPAPGNPGAPPVTRGPNGYIVPPGVTPVPVKQTDTSGLPGYYTERQVWSYNEGRSLQAFAMAGTPCAGVRAKVLGETATSVTVLLESLATPQGGPDVCAEVLEPKPVAVALSAPLGQRTVILRVEP